MGDTSIKFEVIPGKNQKSEYVMTCGKHTVRGWCEYTRTHAHTHSLIRNDETNIGFVFAFFNYYYYSDKASRF
jgi:hypothetical protein